MRGFLRYLRISLKRSVHLIPKIILFSLLFAVGAVAVFLLIFNINSVSEGKSQGKVGVVGEIEENYLGIGLDTMREEDDTRYTLDFIPVATEEEAIKMLDSGDLNGYAVIPDGFSDLVGDGEDVVINYYMKKSTVSLKTALIEEIINGLSSTMSETQTGLFALMDWYRDNDSVDEEHYKYLIYLEYVDLALTRTEMTEGRVIKGVGSGTMSGILCGVFVFFIALLGISCASVISYDKDKLSLFRMMGAKGTGFVKTVLGDYLSFITVAASVILIIGLIGGLAVEIFDISLGSFGVRGFKGVALLSVKMLLPMISLCAFSMMICEICSGIVEKVTMQFIVSAALCYVSGCFYPSGAFPEALRTAASFLPHNGALNCAYGFLSNKPVDIRYYAVLAVWTVISLTVVSAVRSGRIKGE